MPIRPTTRSDVNPDHLAVHKRISEIGQTLMTHGRDELSGEKSSALAAIALGHVRLEKWRPTSDWTVRANEACHWTRRQPTASAGAGTRT